MRYIHVCVEVIHHSIVDGLRADVVTGLVAGVRRRPRHREVPRPLVQDSPSPAALGGGLGALEVHLGAVAAPRVAGVAVAAGDAQRVLGV